MQKKPKLIGITEKVIIIGKNKKKRSLVARIDTGAVFCSIDKKLVKELNLGPVVRTKVIKNANGISKRDILKCSIKLKDKTVRAEVTIADRSHLKYRALIGQNLLKKTDFLIDPKKRFDKK